MRALERVGKEFQGRMSFMHAARYRALWRAVRGLIRGKQLWLTALGRALPSQARPKHAIKAVDRLLGNQHLYRERFQVSAALTAMVTATECQPVILVDTMEVRYEVVAFSAAIAYRGRSVPIHSMVIRWLNPNCREREQFLDELSKVLPAESRPIIVTDGGFRGEWFDAIAKRGWDYVGRLRGRSRVFLRGNWIARPELHKLAGSKARSLGRVLHPQGRPRSRRLILSAKPRCRHRQKSTRRGPARDNNYRHYRKNAYEPLTLATSLTHSPSRVVRLYKTRMQVEQNFRDLKNHRWGWSMRHCGTRKKERVELLLLIAAVATLAQQLIGIVARRMGLDRRHQANTVTTRTVLSDFFLGALVLDTPHTFGRGHIADALASLRKTIAELARLDTS